jgi:hypothetical protein
VVCFVVFVSVYLVRCNKEYYAVYNAVKAELEKIEGVKVLDMGGNEDVELEEIYATISLSSGDTLRFYDLHRGSFDSTTYLKLTRINQWDFHTTGCNTYIDYEIGFPASYKPLRELKLRSVQEIIKNIDTIKKIVNTIATYPAFDTLVNTKGDTFYYQKYDIWKVPDTLTMPEIECREN